MTKRFKITEEPPIGTTIDSELKALGTYGQNNHKIEVQSGTWWVTTHIDYKFGSKTRKFSLSLTKDEARDYGKVLLKMAAYKARKGKK